MTLTTTKYFDYLNELQTKLDLFIALGMVFKVYHN
jgi:hypothetical protein